MNSKYNNICVIFFFALIGLFALGYYCLNKQKILPVAVQPQNASNFNEPAGAISTTSSGQLVYENKNLGLQFEFPPDWHLSKNTLGDASGHGYLQLFNYDEHQTDKKNVFSKGANKIEISISLNNTYTPSSDYPANSVHEQQVRIGGQEITRVDVELFGGQKMRIYFIPITADTIKFLNLVIFGDDANFSVLDNLVQGVQWSQSA